MNSSVRVNIRVNLGAALKSFDALIARLSMLEAAEKKAEVSTGRFGARLSQSFANIELAGKRLTQTGRILLYNFTIPISLAFGYLVKQSLDLSEKTALLSQVYQTANGSALKLGQTTGQVAQDLNTLQKITVALSNGFGIAQTAVYDIEITFGRAGLAGVKLAQATENAMVLVRAFQVTTEQASSAILTLAVNYGLSGQQTLLATAVLSYAAQQTRADLGTLTAAFVKAAPAAQQLGIDVRHLAAFIAVMQQAGFKGAESGTALNFALTRLLTPTPAAVALFKQFGVNLTSASYQTKNATQRIEFLAQSMAHLNDIQRQQAIVVLIGARQNQKMTALFKDLTSQTGLYADLLKKTSNATQLQAWLDNQLALAMDNNATKFQILKTQITNNFLAIANYLTPALLAATNAVRVLSQKFAELGNTVGGRRVQALIVLGAVFMALIGPMALVVASMETLIGVSGRFVEFMATRFIPMLLTPWGLLAVGLAAVVVLAIRFRDAFVQVLVSMYNAVLVVAKDIYAALQWLNPFAHHSPSLVEQTRDGVAAMVESWRGLSPILSVMDTASAAVRRLESAMSAFTNSQQHAADLANEKIIQKVAGADAVLAYKNLITANQQLAKTLPEIDAAYGRQADVVMKAKAAYDAASASVDNASASLTALNAQKDALTKQLASIGNPESLRSQATAMSDMARAIAAAGNSTLAKQFADQAGALGSQADKAEAVQGQINSLTDQIDKQQASVDALTAARDALSKTYDTENAQLQLLVQGYQAVQQQIDANRSSMDSLAASAQSAVKAQKAASGAGAASGKFAAFKGAAGAGNVAVSGAGALAGLGAVKQDAGSLDAYLKDLNIRQAARLTALFGNPFGAVHSWISGALKALSGGRSALTQGWANATSALTDSSLSRGVRSAVTAALVATASLFAAVGKDIAQFAVAAMPGVANLLKSLLSFGKAVFDAVVTIGRGVLPIIATVVAAVAGLLSGTGGHIASALGQAVSVVANILAGLVRIATTILQAVTPVLSFILGIIGTIASVLNNPFAKGVIVTLALAKAFMLIGTALKVVAVEKLWSLGESLASLTLSAIAAPSKIAAGLSLIPRAGAGALSFFASFNPFVVGAAVVVGLLAYQWNRNAEANRAAKAAAAEWVKQQQEVTPILQGNIQSLADQRNALEASRQALVNHGVVILQSGKNAESTTAQWRTLGAQAGALDKAISSDSDKIKKWTQTLYTAAANAGITDNAAQVLASTLGIDLSKGVDDVTAKLRGARDMIGPLGLVAVPQFNDAMSTLASKTATAADKTQALNNALETMAANLGNESAAQDNLSRSLNSLNDALRTNGNVISGNTNKALDNRDAFRAVKDQMYAALEAANAHGKGLTALQGIYDETINKIEAIGHQHHLTKIQVDLLLNRLGLSKTDFAKFIANINATTNPVTQLATQLERARDAMIALVAAGKHPVPKPGLPVPAFAKGGVVSKPTLALIGEAGPEVVLPLSAVNNPMIARMNLLATQVHRMSRMVGAVRANIPAQYASAADRRATTLLAPVSMGGNVTNNTTNVYLSETKNADPTYIAAHVAWAQRRGPI